MRTSTALDDYKRLCFSLILIPIAAVLFIGGVGAPQDRPPLNAAILLTIFLKHDQSKTLDEIQAQLRKTGFYKNFPPEGVEVVSWYVMMGVGQVVTLRVPAEQLRAVNRHSVLGVRYAHNPGIKDFFRAICAIMPSTRELGFKNSNFGDFPRAQWSKNHFWAGATKAAA